ncbi:MAP7 domain-containing protein 2 isoform X3 [Trematomus bernacchii]|uniref:MAP7 domain-containing protein 2 isoform X3 n=1 Tax=Trematomus bernacchii TaxID=40690 RepID=UPI00146C8433|nr:MAP7 domain-containing protein 2 isoform X3 [Trematomus bernacchii]
MPGSKASMAVQKKHIPPSQGPLSTRTIESQRKRNASEKAGDNAGYLKPNSQAKKTACSVNNAAKICNTASPRPNAVSNGLNVDERLKAARERREEHQRLLASRENGRMEREQRARRYYELQIQERRKKLLDQRLKEERKRTAVEEKRKQRLKEDKERYESAVRRTVEKSQRAQQSQNSRGRKLTKNLSFHSMNSTTNSTPHKPQQLHHRNSPSPNYSQHRSSNLAEIEASSQKDTKKKNSNTKSPAVSTSVKPAKDTLSRTTSPSPERSSRRSMSRHSPPLQLELPSVPEEDISVSDSVSDSVSVLSPGNSRPVRKTSEGQTRGENPPEAPRLNLPDKETTRQRSPPQKPLPADPQPPEVTCRPSAGTTDAGQASRLLAERRREARQQREREERQQRESEEQERLQREEAERRSREDLDLRRAEQRERQQAEDHRLVEEKKRREEEEQKRAEEERAQAMKEAVLLQRQREEEQAKERAKAEQLKQEREIIALKEEAARTVRKKRLEEIMRRTRRSDSPDTKSVPARILPDEAQPKENTEPVLRGSIEAAVKLPVGTKSSGLNNEEDVVPVVAFKERRSLRTLSGLEEIQTHQRAEVI